MVIIVSRNPRLVCTVKAVPIWPFLQSSLIAALNCAESATTAKPQTRHTLIKRTGFPPNKWKQENYLHFPQFVENIRTEKA